MEEVMKMFQIQDLFVKENLDKNRIIHLVKTDNRARFICFVVFYLTFGWGKELLCNLIGFAYPFVASIKAIESPSSADDTKWLMYWCVYALFGILEIFSDVLLFWIPFYTLLKCLALIWLMLPGKTGGSYVVYHRIVKPFFLQHQKQFDSTYNKANELASKTAELLASSQKEQ